MSAIATPSLLLLIILAGYLFKRFGLVRDHDYRVLQTLEFNLVLPGAVIHSFAVNPHDLRMLWISTFGFLAAFVPPVAIAVATRRRPTTQRAFVVLNGSGFNVGCFCFPVATALLGSSAVVSAAMFDVGACVMTTAGTNVMVQTALHMADRNSTTVTTNRPTPDCPAPRHDRDARRLRRRMLARTIAKGFFGSVTFDTYLAMIVLMICGIPIPDMIAAATEPLAGANTFCSLIMVGMLADLPAGRDDLRAVFEVLAWRLPFGIVFALAAWTLLPFDPVARETAALCCLTPVAVFSTLFTDRTLGNAKLAGFTLFVTAVIALVMMSAAHMIIST
ncbi:AEC family transporter [Bifidobacterium sp. UTBIF-78]|uniref:AEC family transporter n=1 Tax=Bifidobacterium sp. UTBIF-78 TaxID=1465263 RepID=UPI0011268BD2|nr:AEC family transporter [Bifidobacterium sp. UTBIF-78]TPF95060.1 permease [Bifidobacterium sp. UTBIF-78]